MNKLIQLFYRVYQNPMLLSFAVLSFFLGGLLLGELANNIQNTAAPWVYSAVRVIGMVFVFGSFGWSLLHPFICYAENKDTWKKHLLWILLGLVPILYIISSLIITFIAV